MHLAVPVGQYDVAVLPLFDLLEQAQHVSQAVLVPGLHLAGAGRVVDGESDVHGRLLSGRGRVVVAQLAGVVAGHVVEPVAAGAAHLFGVGGLLHGGLLRGRPRPFRGSDSGVVQVGHVPAAHVVAHLGYRVLTVFAFAGGGQLPAGHQVGGGVTPPIGREAVHLTGGVADDGSKSHVDQRAKRTGTMSPER